MLTISDLQPLSHALPYNVYDVICCASQGFQLHCPACGYVSTTLHNHRQLQQALSCSHPTPKSGRPCNHLTKLHKEVDLLQAHPATESLSTAPQHKACEDRQFAAAGAGRKSSRRKKQRQADSDLQGDLMETLLAKRVMGVILANMAMHIITDTPSGRGSKFVHDGSAGQRLSPWRPWAVRTLTEVGT
jgi:hypothetical protein